MKQKKKDDDDEEKMAFLVKGPSMYYVSTFLDFSCPIQPLCQHKYITERQKILPFSEPTPESFSLRNILMVPKRKGATNTMMVDLLAKFGVDACKTSLEFISPPPVITFFRRGLSKLIKKPAK